MRETGFDFKCAACQREDHFKPQEWGLPINYCAICGKTFCWRGCFETHGCGKNYKSCFECDHPFGLESMVTVLDTNQKPFADICLDCYEKVWAPVKPITSQLYKELPF